MRTALAVILLVTGCKDKKTDPAATPTGSAEPAGSAAAKVEPAGSAVAAPTGSAVAAPTGSAAPSGGSAAPAPADDVVTKWWTAARSGDPKSLTAYPFDAELRDDSAAKCPNGGNVWAKTGAELAAGLSCLQQVVTATDLPTTWQDGWKCDKFSASKNATRVQEEHEKRKERLRCGVNAKGVNVFVATTDKGVSAVMISSE